MHLVWTGLNKFRSNLKSYKSWLSVWFSRAASFQTFFETFQFLTKTRREGRSCQHCHCLACHCCCCRCQIKCILVLIESRSWVRLPSNQCCDAGRSKKSLKSNFPKRGRKNFSFWSMSMWCKVGRGGSASGRAMAICPSGPGSNPRTNFGFFLMRLSLYSRWALRFFC